MDLEALLGIRLINSLVAVPPAMLLHLNLPRSKHLFEITELPRSSLEPASGSATIESLAERVSRRSSLTVDASLVEVEHHLKLAVARD
jgi:hypothetical protein